MTPHIVYFDGLCGLCDRFARFAAARDRKRKLRFAALQGETARTRLSDRFEWAKEPVTIVFEDPKRFRTGSDAVLAIVAMLGGVWRLAPILRVVPRPIRDAVYDFIARRRKRWFGSLDSCRLPTPAERDRFLP
ncbi:MAG: DUF393 domain-containing protein [Gemmatimonadales bacterium]|nr:DUF393 domain-containing protein [Gemmatimonadales bacterium]